LTRFAIQLFEFGADADVPHLKAVDGAGKIQVSSLLL
jgi:hypothetical protein